LIEPPIYVGIPVRGRLDLTTALLGQLEDDGGYVAILVFDNGSPADELAVLRKWAGNGRIKLHETPNHSITSMWNAMWSLVVDRHGADPANLAVLNNDLVLPPRFIEHLSHALREPIPDGFPVPWVVYPDYNLAPLVRDPGRVPTGIRTPTTGSYRHGGICGWAWMARTENRDAIAAASVARGGGQVCRPIDETMLFWCNDDDLAFSVVEAGGGVYRVDGLPVFHIGEASGVTPEQHSQRQADLARCFAKWRR